ncbi:MAG TPA: flagellar hook-basal body complex protein FliE [Conexibacter sp.]|nr:flagellar hook-basal body complex protein FliE [Conexibacter sp.]
MTVVPPVGALGPEWQIAGLGGLDAPPAPDAVAGASGGGFGDVLAHQIGNLSDLQETAASASQSLANGTATDVSSVVTAVEKAQLAMQLAGQIRTKGSEAINDIFHTQI